MTLITQSVRVETGSLDEDGYLVFSDGKLVAVLVRLSEEQGAFVGQWYVEKGFGRLDVARHPIFPDMDEAQSWVEQMLF